MFAVHPVEEHRTNAEVDRAVYRELVMGLHSSSRQTDKEQVCDTRLNNGPL